MDRFFDAKSVAIIGASRTHGKIGNVILHNFVKHFDGKIYPVNPNTDKIFGKKCYRKITSIPYNVDLAVIAVPAQIVPFVLQECVVKEVKGAIIISGGFSEVGRKDLQKDIEEVVAKTKMRVIGPNCIGVFDPYSGIDSLFLPELKLNRPKKGGISFITQSGAVGSLVLDKLAVQGFGISKFISYGNAVDINEVDALEFLGRDKNTKIICMYLEGAKNGRKLIEVARKIKKPIIVVKAGKTQEGKQAAASHTATLAGNDLVYNAAFEKAGIIRADGITEMFDFARVLLEQPFAKGKHVQIVTNGGGFGVLATDTIIESGMKLARMNSETRHTLKKRLPTHAVVSNPLDLVGDATPEDYKIALHALEDDEKVDAVLCLILFQTAGMGPGVVKIISDFSKNNDTPIVVCSDGGDFTQKQVKEFERLRIPVFDSPKRAVNALSCLMPID